MGLMRRLIYPWHNTIDILIMLDANLMYKAPVWYWLLLHHILMERPHWNPFIYICTYLHSSRSQFTSCYFSLPRFGLYILWLLSSCPTFIYFFYFDCPFFLSAIISFRLSICFFYLHSFLILFLLYFSFFLLILSCFIYQIFFFFYFFLYFFRYYLISFFFLHLFFRFYSICSNLFHISFAFFLSFYIIS